MKIEIPGCKTVELKHLLLDYNGTIAVDGKIPEAVREKLHTIGEELKIHVLTADTHNTAKSMCEGLPLTVHTFPGKDAAPEKLRVLKELGADRCIAVGNGCNDIPMCKEAALSVAIIGEEGAASQLLQNTDIAVTGILQALELLEKPKRMIATLRG